MPKIYLLNEPELFFRNNQKCLDPQIGLLSYGPHGGVQADTHEKITIKAGIIGTNRSIDATELFIRNLSMRINPKDSNTDYQGILFPGLDVNGVLGFDIALDKNCILTIKRKFVKNLKKYPRKERILKCVAEYIEKLNLMEEADPPPQVIYLPLDEELLSLTKDPNQIGDKIVYRRRQFGESDFYEVQMFDFHHHIKAQASIRNFTTQMITPGTLIFSERKQQPSIIAWNFAVGSYYKATGTPWKLSEIDDKTCYIGLSFYNEITDSAKSIKASIAQVYMRTGESQVIRTKPGNWFTDKTTRSVYISSKDMKKIITDSIELFEKQRRFTPNRIVVHKTSQYTLDEKEGCDIACEDIDEVDLVQIKKFVQARAYHEKYDFPVVRGTIISEGNEALLFTTGYIPALGTYQGPMSPRPLHIICHRLDTSLSMVCKDILGLTKLDWNSSRFCTRLPVTLSVSEKVGEIMAELVYNHPSNIPKSYRFFM